MGSFFKRKRDPQETEKEIVSERVSVIDSSLEKIYVNNQKVSDLLQKLENETDMVKCIDTIITETADGKMAYNIYLRLANQGFDVTWKNAANGRPVKRYDAEFRDWCSRMGKNNSSGIDGLLDVLHGCAIARGGMAVEVLVNKGVTDVDEIAIVDPASIKEFVWLPEENRYAAYQQQSNGTAKDLYEGNFFWIPFEPKAGRPDGTLKFQPAVYTTIQYLKLLQDSTAVLHRIGFPRYDVTIDRKTFIDSLNDKSPEAVQSACTRLFQDMKSKLGMLNRSSDFLHFDEVKMETIGGGVNGAGIDVRAWFEVLEPQIINSYSLTPVLMGRLKSGSYSLGSVEFKIVTDTVDSMRRGSKRILEEVFKIWARVHGYNIIPTVTHNPIDWEKELDKLESQLKTMEVYRRAEEYGYIERDEAASRSMGVEGASGKSSDGLYEYLSKDFRNKEQTPQSESQTQQNQSEGGIQQNEPESGKDS